MKKQKQKSILGGLVFYLTFSYLWTSQVIGNVCLATMAGGPYGGMCFYPHTFSIEFCNSSFKVLFKINCTGWYYYGPASMGEMASLFFSYLLQSLTVNYPCSLRIPLDLHLSAHQLCRWDL